MSRSCIVRVLLAAASAGLAGCETPSDPEGDANREQPSDASPDGDASVGPDATADASADVPDAATTIDAQQAGDLPEGGCDVLMQAACDLPIDKFCQATMDEVQMLRADHAGAAAERACSIGLEFFLDPRYVLRGEREPVQPSVAASGSPPVAKGGEIAGGVYLLHAMEGFPHASCERSRAGTISAGFVFGAATSRAGIFYGGTSTQGGSDDALFLEELVIGSTRYAASGTSLGLNFSASGLEYSAEGDTLLLIWRMASCTWVSTFVRH